MMGWGFCAFFTAFVTLVASFSILGARGSTLGTPIL